MGIEWTVKLIGQSKQWTSFYVMTMGNSYYEEALWLQNLSSNNFSDLVLVLITNKTHYTITMLCVENSYVEVNM